MVHRVIILAATVFFLGTAQAYWEQCGGTGWAGSKACTNSCVCTYSQCLPGSATTTKSPTTTSSTSKSSTITSTPGSTSGPKYWFTSGDSYTATSFSITGTKPNDANPFGNPTYPGYTTCGQVTNWIDEMVVLYNEAKIYAYNFAYGGTTINATIFPSYTSTVLSMTDQMNEFLNNVASHPSYAPWTSAHSIFSFFIGINDVSGTWYKDWGNWTAYTLTLASLHMFQAVLEIG
ncbi:carbohydrate esterase family 16 protein [Tulasnella calospora MUT 4182]|uniref:Carbohydrate esterase family 16 protein n=1 Tax=Tulasnella calospora MUT 4182 TaxID=1051891 RepID=A0A0C3QHS0_9AGAM|nr:carbohydrate esterase family 16 protein [Tulasnella calospora MUT 4182]